MGATAESLAKTDLPEESRAVTTQRMFMEAPWVKWEKGTTRGTQLGNEEHGWEWDTLKSSGSEA